ncbi:hypothetical protein PanWU01x14_312970 [Parasponia andersonii]|uniref:Uncharacterized protein n=1 Tax=Parasponia andersonii TaxID=3476 RepID=A0A2P5APH5_PARAD|nr:hypothetical protein PanWU01x14_312970 [Parasponia andersonii]
MAKSFPKAHQSLIDTDNQSKTRARRLGTSALPAMELDLAKECLKSLWKRHGQQGFASLVHWPWASNTDGRISDGLQHINSNQEEGSLGYRGP